LHPEQKIIIYSSLVTSSKLIDWTSNEHRKGDVKIENRITLDEIKNINPEQISIEMIDFNSYKINNNISVIHKADFIRVRKLYEHGGMWFDFDILFIKRIPDELFDGESTFNYFKVSNVVPTGLIFVIENHPVIKKILDSIYQLINKPNKEYQFIGPSLWGDMINKYGAILNSTVLQNSLIYPYKYDRIDKFFYTN